MGKVGTWQLSAHQKTGNFSSLEYQVLSFPRESDAQLNSVYDFKLAVSDVNTHFAERSVKLTSKPNLAEHIRAHTHTKEIDVPAWSQNHQENTLMSLSTQNRIHCLSSTSWIVLMNRNSGRIRALSWYLIIIYQSHNNNDHLTRPQEGWD